MTQIQYDLIIAGAGPAGMTAAVYAARKGLNVCLVSKDFGGQVAWTMGIENYMGFQYIESAQLIEKFREQVEQFPVDLKTGETIVSLSRLEGGFELGTDRSNSYRSRALIIATGKRPRRLDVPGEERLQGRGVTYCAICDGPVFAGEKVVVVGGGNSALEAADDMVNLAEHIYLVTADPDFRADQILIDRAKKAPNLTMLMEHEVVEIQGADRVEGVLLRRPKKEYLKVDAAGVLVEIGLIPNSEFARGVARLNELGEITINCCCGTEIPGLFAAGDVTNILEKQIVVAAGEGAKAAIQAHRYLQRVRMHGGSPA
ncbi:MAG: FAD-dependent oxidoreductase [Dehalococcoidia bacterium]|nr:FAD-dependent oxidoreductase [Dehalococcoidia bacterium]